MANGNNGPLDNEGPVECCASVCRPDKKYCSEFLCQYQGNGTAAPPRERKDALLGKKFPYRLPDDDVFSEHAEQDKI